MSWNKRKTEKHFFPEIVRQLFVLDHMKFISFGQIVSVVTLDLSDLLQSPCVSLSVCPA